MKTELKDYTLWYDGTIQLHPDDLPDLILRGVDISKLAVTEITDDVKKYNKLTLKNKLKIKEQNEPLEISWSLPDSYMNLNIDNYTESVLLPLVKKDSLYNERLKRVVLELGEIETRGWGMVFRVLVYIIDTLKSKNVLWGVGRGSSCAVYLFYLMGLHCVDPVEYDIPMTDFFK